MKSFYDAITVEQIDDSGLSLMLTDGPFDLFIHLPSRQDLVQEVRPIKGGADH